jgi:hypothetical protein
MNPSRCGRPLSHQSSSCFPEKALDQSPGRGFAAVFCVATKSAPLQWAWALGLVMACLTGGFATSRLQAQTASFSDAIATLGGGFSNPSGVAVDGSGNVYVADYNNSAVKEMPAGCASSSCVTTLGGGFNHPFGVAVDGSGNVYVADTDNNAVKEMPAGCASSSCVTTLGGASSNPQQRGGGRQRQRLCRR